LQCNFLITPPLLPHFSDTHLLAKLLADCNSQIVWLTECLLSTRTAVQNRVQNGGTAESTFPFCCDVTIDELHKAYRSWMEIKNRQDNLMMMYKNIVYFHKGLKSIVPVPDDVNSATSFVLEWYHVESGILKTRLGLDPLDPDTLENSPFRRVAIFYLTF
jgi:hypothetical protein